MNDFNTTTIEETVKAYLRDIGVADKIYNSRPTSVDEQTTSFVVVKVSGNIADRAGYGTCVISVHLFAKDVSNVKNGKKLSVMQEKLYAGLPADIDRLLLSQTPTVLSDVADDYGFHARIINIETIIKAV